MNKAREHQIAQTVESLKAARFGSRDLDADFFEALGYPVIRYNPGRGHSWRKQNPETNRWEALSNVTTSLDAIVRQVPPGWYWNAARRDTPLGVLTGEGYVRNKFLVSVPGSVGFDEFAHTPELALCAAVLQARVYLQAVEAK